MDATAFPLPDDTREVALGIICEQLKAAPELATRLATFGDLPVVQAVLALEERFGVLIDMDEVLPGLTVAGLLLLVQKRVLLGPRTLPGGATLYALAAYRRARDLGLPEPTPETGWPVMPALAPEYADALAPTALIVDPPWARPAEAVYEAAPCEPFAPRTRARRARHHGQAAVIGALLLFGAPLVLLAVEWALHQLQAFVQ